MSNILKELGIDEEDVKWYHLSSCQNMPINWFYDEYENDPILANTVDELCLSCPVAIQCLNDGIENKEKGVRGAVYLNLGRVDKLNNAHKSKETKERVKKLHGKTKKDILQF